MLRGLLFAGSPAELVLESSPVVCSDDQLRDADGGEHDAGKYHSRSQRTTRVDAEQDQLDGWEKRARCQVLKSCVS